MSTATLSSRAAVRNSAPLPLFRKALSDSWRSLIAWLIGLSAAMFLYIPLFPSIGGNQQMQDLIKSLPPALVEAIGYSDIASGAGYVQATYFGLMGFALTTIAAVSWGAAAIGTDEESGRLELTLAHGVTRRQVVWERYAALLVRILALGAWSYIVIALLNNSAQLNLNLGRLAVGILMLTGLAVLSGSAAFLGGALSGRRVWGIGLGTLVAVAGYAFNAVGNQSKGLKWLHNLSPYSWAYGNKPLVNDIDFWPYLGLYGLSALCLVASLLILQKRDVGV